MTTEHFTAAPIPVVGGQLFEFNVWLNSGSSLWATVSWLSAQKKSIATSVTDTVGAGGNAIMQGTAPSNGVQAVITVSIAHSPDQVSEFSGMHFQQTLPGPPGSSSLSLTAPTYVNAGPYTTTTTLTGRITDDHQYTWATPQGNFQVGGFGKGTAWPLTPGARSLALLPGLANTNVGVTFRSGATAGMTQGLIFRYSSDSNYWRASRTQLQKKAAGIWTTVGTFATPFADNDRMVVNLSGSAIAVYRNGNNEVFTVSDSFNASATQHGLVVE